MQLPDQFKHFIQQEGLFQQKDKLLLAVSGGVDSVVLCELCKQAGFNFAIAHCNFQLRGEESERDEAFVKKLGAEYDVPVHVNRFDTEEHARTNKLSIQVAARQLRYQWFEEIRKELALKFIATAHHADDNIETMLMNFFKGTGIAGLRGILPKQGNIVRPLLFASKEVIKEFALQYNLQWVEDSSNAEDKYTRNYIRHKLLPVITEIYPQAASNLANNLQRFREAEWLYRQSADQLLKKMVEKKGEELHIPVLKLKKTNAAGTLLHELIHPMGFTSKQVDEVLHLIESETGRYVASPTHRVLRNRDWLIIAPLDNTIIEHVLIEEGQSEVVFAGGKLNITHEHSAPDNLDQSSDTALLNASDIQFPLILRKWMPGDYFYPLGLRKKKKVARFFIDQKLSATDKEKVWVLESNKKILWILGHRIDDRFKLPQGAKNILRIKWLS